MFTQEELKAIDHDLRAGATPDEVAKKFSVSSRGNLIYRLLNSGKRLRKRTEWWLEDAVPAGVDQSALTTAAH